MGKSYFKQYDAPLKMVYMKEISKRSNGNTEGPSSRDKYFPAACVTIAGYKTMRHFLNSSRSDTDSKIATVILRWKTMAKLGTSTILMNYMKVKYFNRNYEK